MSRKEIKKFLKRRKMTAGGLADAAGINRWSLKRYLDRPESTITLKTAEKLKAAMGAIEIEAAR